MAGLVDLLPFMLHGYEWQGDTMHGFTARMQDYKDLVELKGNYNVWLLRKFIVA